MHSGGQVKQAVHISKTIIRTTGNIVNDLTTGLSKVIGGLTNGLELVAKAAGGTLNSFSKNLEVTSIRVLTRVGDLGMTVAKDLGDVIQIIPILGKPAAYVVKGSGRGIYYVVTSVGNVVGKSVRSVGHVGKEASDLVVFTIASTSTATEKTIQEAGDVVKKVAKSLTTRNRTVSRISKSLSRTFKKRN